MAGLIARNKAAATTYKSLDERINLVAGKVMMMMMAIMIMRIMINLVNNNDDDDDIDRLCIWETSWRASTPPGPGPRRRSS